MRDYKHPSTNVYYYIMLVSLKSTLIISVIVGFIGLWLMSKVDPWQGFRYGFSIAFFPKLLFDLIVKFLEYKNIGFRVESRNFYLTSGFFSKNTVNLPVDSIDNASFHQTLIQRLFNVGQVTIISKFATTTSPALDPNSANKLIEAVKHK